MKSIACYFVFCATISLVAADAVESGLSLNSSAPEVTISQPPVTIEQPFFSSCKEVPTNISGFYSIRISNDSAPFRGYCDQQEVGGGWLVIQLRFDGSVDFYRNWTEYREGFGNTQEFWIGLERLHQLTVGTPHELMVQVRDFEEVNAYAWYGEFEIGGESEQYQLKKLGRYSGSAGDSMRQQEGKKFSTKDRDNDEDSTRHCAQEHEGAWWYGGCSDANLNGRYMNEESTKALYWYHFYRNYEGLDYSRMMIRPLE